MNFNAAFVHNYPVVHTCFIGSFFFLLQIFLKADWKHSWYYPLSLEKKRIKDFVTKKRFSFLLERRRITRRLTACLIVNRGTGALTANALTAKPAEKHQERGGDFFFFY